MKNTLRTLFRLLAAVGCALMAAGCRPNASVRLSGEAVYTPREATGYTILATDGTSTVIEVRNPWQREGDAATQLFVARNGECPPEGFAGQVVEAPIESAVCFSATHVAYLDAVGRAEIIRGVSGAEYLSNEQVREGYAAGRVRDIGYDANLNYELLAALRPDVVFIYGVGGEANTAVTDKLDELHIPYLYIGEYVEETPLGKAEWVVPFGELTDRRAEGIALFDGIASRYATLRERASHLTDRPVVMVNAPFRDVWFAPGDRSYMVRYIEDAAGDYAFKGTDEATSRPISAEAAYLAAQTADVWLNPNMTYSMADLKAQNPKFADIRCVNEGRVYNCTRRRTAGGGSDFWESGALYADRVLHDLILCLHPEAAEEMQIEGITPDLYYYEQLQ